MSRQKFTFYALMLVAIALTASCGGETVVTKVKLDAPPGTQPNEGVLFSLPETVVMAEVPLTKVASSPGKFSKWTPFFFPELTTDEFTTEEKTVFKVGLATFSTRGQTDPKNVYIAHIKAKQFETKTLLLEFNEDGIVARTEASSKDESIDVITSTAKTVASIVAPLLPGGGALSLITSLLSGTYLQRKVLRLKSLSVRKYWPKPGKRLIVRLKQPRKLISQANLLMTMPPRLPGRRRKRFTLNTEPALKNGLSKASVTKQIERYTNLSTTITNNSCERISVINFSPTSPNARFRKGAPVFNSFSLSMKSSKNLSTNRTALRQRAKFGRQPRLCVLRPR